MESPFEFEEIELKPDERGNLTVPVESIATLQMNLLRAAKTAHESGNKKLVEQFTVFAAGLSVSLSLITPGAKLPASLMDACKRAGIADAQGNSQCGCGEGEKCEHAGNGGKHPLGITEALWSLGLLLVSDVAQRGSGKSEDYGQYL